MALYLNFWLLLFGVLQGLLLSFVLIKKKTLRAGYGFLIIYLLVMIAQILFKVADKQLLMDGSLRTYILSYKFPFLYGPLIWLFIRRLVNQKVKISWLDIFHFLPFIYSVVVLQISNSLDSFTGIFWLMAPLPAMILQLLSLLTYHILALVSWQLNNKKLNDKFSNIHAFKMQWITKFICYSLIISVGISVVIYLIYLWHPNHDWMRFGFLSLSFFIYWISYSALQQPALFTAIKDEETTEEKPLAVQRPVKKYEHSTLSETDAHRIINELDSIMHRENLYKEPDINIIQLAKRLDVNRYILSQVLNEYLNKSFYDYINGLRIEAAKDMLADPKFHNHKIASIGYDAGFNSLSTFNVVFKKMTGLTPSQYKNKSVEHQQSQRL
jgi:AraC-like DNA-binding protein